MKYNSLKNKIATYSLLLGMAISPTQLQGSWYSCLWPFGGEKKQEQKQEKVEEQTVIENTKKYLSEKEKENKSPKLPETPYINNKQWQALNEGLDSLIIIYKDFLPDSSENDNIPNKDALEKEYVKGMTNIVSKIKELNRIRNAGTLTVDAYGVLKTPRTDIYLNEEFPILYKLIKNAREQANQGNEGALGYINKTENLLREIERIPRIHNIARENLEEKVISPIEQQANKGWAEKYWYIPTGIVAAATGTAIYCATRGKGEEEKVYNIGDWENNTR